MKELKVIVVALVCIASFAVTVSSCSSTSTNSAISTSSLPSDISTDIQ